MIYTNLLVNGRLVEQRTHWTLDQANEYAEKMNAEGNDCRVYVKDADRERTVYPV